MNAEFSKCGTYRYVLKREIPCLLRWVKPVLFIMLNPSTADEVNNDPTIRRCISFANREHCTDLTVVNIFALRATDPRELKRHKDPVGPKNDERIDSMIFRHLNYGIVVAAWGAHPMARERGQQLINKYGEHILCLGTTKQGSPRHPLYVKSDQKLLPLKNTLIVDRKNGTSR